MYFYLHIRQKSSTFAVDYEKTMVIDIDRFVLRNFRDDELPVHEAAEFRYFVCMDGRRFVD